MKTAICLALFVAVAFGAQEHHAPGCVLAGKCMQTDYVLQHRANEQDVIRVSVKAHYDNMELLKNTLYTISDPDSKFYGQWLSHDEVQKMVINKERIAKIEKFLNKRGFKTTTKGPYVEAFGSVKNVEKTFNTECFVFHSQKSGRKITRSTKLTVPSEIEDDVFYVDGLVDFPPTIQAAPMFSANKPVGNRTIQSNQVVPSLLQSFYKVDSSDYPVPSGSAGTSQSVFESLGQSYAPSDLSAFESQYTIPAQKIKKVIGPNDPSSCQDDPNNCAEASLDVQYIIAMGQGVDTYYWSIGGEADIFYEWATAMIADASPPLITSMSYGSIETEESSTRMKGFDNDIVTLTAKGVTVLVSSGDDGVANFMARQNPGACGYNPSFPATSPHVLAVGATQGPEFNSPEIACQSNAQPSGLITTGGGFSTVFAQPSYQTAAVTAYLNSPEGKSAQSGYNAQGRGYPDIAMLGHNYVVFIGGQQYALSGTSCSSPVTAGMYSLINAQRQKAGKTPIGFVNPVVYKNTDAFNRITKGKNNCCAGNDPVCCSQGFTAWNGWAPLCGWGTTNYPKVKAAFMAIL